MFSYWLGGPSDDALLRHLADMPAAQWDVAIASGIAVNGCASPKLRELILVEQRPRIALP